MFQNHGSNENQIVMMEIVKSRLIVLTRDRRFFGFTYNWYYFDNFISPAISKLTSKIFDKPFCQNHPKCDPKCKGDGCNHPDCKEDPRCPQLPEERNESKISKFFYMIYSISLVQYRLSVPQQKIRNKCNPLDPNDKNCDWSGPLENPNNGLCGACNYPQVGKHLGPLNIPVF